MKERERESTSNPIHSGRFSAKRRTFAAISVSVLLVSGVVAGATYGTRLATERLHAIATAEPEKQLAQPLGPVEITPMVSAPYRPASLEGGPPPAVTEPARAELSTEEGTNGTAVGEDKLVSCSGGTVLERDICADPELRALHARIVSALDTPADPRFREYVTHRETWCGPQPSRANRQECLLDLGRKLLEKL